MQRCKGNCSGASGISRLVPNPVTLNIYLRKTYYENDDDFLYSDYIMQWAGIAMIHFRDEYSEAWRTLLFFQGHWRWWGFHLNPGLGTRKSNSSLLSEMPFSFHLTLACVFRWYLILNLAMTMSMSSIIPLHMRMNHLMLRQVTWLIMHQK